LALTIIVYMSELVQETEASCWEMVIYSSTSGIPFSSYVPNFGVFYF